MSFRQAVGATPNLGQDVLRPGLQALGADSVRIHCGDPRKLKGSVDIDAALLAADPNGHRWDYAVGHNESGSDKVYWVEIHPASDHGVTELLAKVAWLNAWLGGDGHRLKGLTKAYVWISSGRTSFTKTSPAARKLAQKGVISAGGYYTLN